MRFLMLLGGWLMAVVLLPLTPLRGADPSVYEVRMTRAAKKGDRFLRIGSAREESSRLLEIDRQPVSADETKIDLQYELEVEVLKARWGRATSLRAKILKLTGTMNGQAITQLEVGDQITVTRTRESEDSAILVNGKPADEDQQALAANLVNVGTDRTPDDDAIFGTRDRVQVGAAWKVNGQNALALLGEIGKSLRPEDVQGSTKLVDVVESEGKSYLNVRSEFAVRGSGFDVPSASDLRITRYETNVMASGNFPVDVEDKSMPSQMVGLNTVIEMEGMRKEPGGNKEISFIITMKAARKESLKALP